ncbi:MAG: ABC transporter ATP-binding protein [Cryomorphaceae bacterium]|nr:ABC transporter ATP-binding protein [Cryomorphaceae bacterium]
MRSFFKNFNLFHTYLGYRVYVLVFAGVIITLLDGLGIAMFLPLLEIAGHTSDGVATGEEFGKLFFLVNLYAKLGLLLDIRVVLISMLIFFGLKGFFVFLEAWFSTVYRHYFVRNLRHTTIMGLANYKFIAFAQADAGRVQSTISAQVGAVANGFSHFTQVLRNMVMLVVYAGMALLVNPIFSLYVLVGVVLTYGVFLLIYRTTKKKSSALSTSQHAFHRLLIQQVAMFPYLKATGLMRFYAKKLLRKVDEIEDNQRSMGVLHAIGTGIKEPLVVAIIVVVILIQVNVMNESISVILLAMVLFYRAMGSAMGLQTAWNSFLQTHGAFESVKEFTKGLSLWKEDQGEFTFTHLEEGLRLNNISFGYLDREFVLKDINLSVKKHERIALVGHSGSGKTTLVNIVCGLLRPTQGKLEIDGVDATKLKIESFQRRIGYITQDPVVFNDTLYNNVTFWAPKNRENLIKFSKVMAQSALQEYVVNQSKREDTLLGNKGMNLSGGQKQRLSIARELYKAVDILIFDEATSALDSETEQIIQSQLEALKGKYTIITIAHRLSTIREVDRIVLLDQGEVAAEGTYADLMEKSDLFKKMVHLQAVK